MPLLHELKRQRTKRSAEIFFLCAFIILSNKYKIRFHHSDLEAGMTPFAKAAATLAGCIGAFTVVVCLVEVLAN
jgi:hypothetical protein